MKIAILGTRGIPNQYGGFEQFAQYLSAGLAARGHEVVVYNAHHHPYQQKYYQGVQIIHQYDPEKSIGTAGQFVYDLNCILDSRKREFDIILQLGYTSSSVWNFLLPGGAVVLTNMDGMEWKRSKYNTLTKKFLMHAERLAVKSSHHLVADSLGIQTYLRRKYGTESTYIPYGAWAFNSPSAALLKVLKLDQYDYDMLVARLEPENNIEMILMGVAQSKSKTPMLVIGNHETKYGNYLKKLFKADSRIRFTGGIYDIDLLNNLRYFSRLYFHGHSVGGTNPSLLEAMASQALICAHENPFNSSILGDDAYYFGNAATVSRLRDSVQRDKAQNAQKVAANYSRILFRYSWENIISDYEQLMIHSLNKQKFTAKTTYATTY